MKFTAYVATNSHGSRCETEFEIADEAMDAVFGDSLVRVWHEEAGE